MERKRVTLVADELRGVQGGGIGTATSHLALALGRMGHDVHVLYVAPRRDGIDPDWAQLYASASVRVSDLERRHGPTEPPFFGRMLDAADALRADEPDVVITQDLGAPAYVALRLKHLGLAFARTLFVVYCHGTRRWITDVARKVRVLPGALAVTLLERASLECADCVVSPSEYLVEWMRRQGWRLPARTTTIPYLTRSGATGETAEASAPSAGDARLERIAFFGRLEERKGIDVFLRAINLVQSSLLAGVELTFVGVPTKAWPPSRVEDLLSARAKAALAAIRFHTHLEQQEALAELERPGTLAVMPSLADNSPNTVYECLERGVPFVASRIGGTAELVAAEDRDLVLFEPTAAGVAAALTRALETSRVPRPARPAFDDGASRRAWEEIVTSPAPPRPAVDADAPIDVDVVVSGPNDGPSRCADALERQRHRPARVVRVRSRAAGIAQATAPWIVFLGEDDEVAEDFLHTLVGAQRAAGADVVTCGVDVVSADCRRTYLFLGEAGGLGLLSNAYGTPALVRRSLLAGAGEELAPDQVDPDWRLLARLGLAGAAIVSVPQVLATRATAPGHLGQDAVDPLLVLQEFEAASPRPLESLARLAAGLAADAAAAAPSTDGIVPRLRRRLARLRR